MPNWCATNYIIHGNKESISKLSDLLNNSYQHHQGWLGSVVEELTGKECSIYARGWMQGTPRIDNNSIQFYAETAWSELNEWREFIQNQFEDVEIEYTAVEPGMGIYITNIEELVGTYYVDDGEIGSIDELTEKELLDYINETYNKHFKKIENALRFIDREHESIYIHQYEYQY